MSASLNSPSSDPTTTPQDQAMAVLDQVLTQAEANSAAAQTPTPTPVLPQVPQVPPASQAAPIAPVAPSSPPQPVFDPMAQVMPQALEAMAQPGQQPPTQPPAAYPATTAKESIALSSQEISSAGPAVEYEPNPEIAPEVESYMEKVESHPEQIPHEVVLSGQDMLVTPPKTMSQPVIVLPITPDEEAVGAKKSPKFSIRWLVEWSRRIMRMFSGKVIYRQD